MKATTIFDGRSRRLAGIPAVLGGLVLLSACGAAAPTAPDSSVEAGLATVESGRVSAQSVGIDYCPRCELIIDPARVPGNYEAHLSMRNMGTEEVGNVHVTGYLRGVATGWQFRVVEVDQAGPRPRQTVYFTVPFTVPSRVPPGQYRVAMVFDPEHPDLPNHTWLSEEIVTVQ